MTLFNEVVKTRRIEEEIKLTSFTILGVFYDLLILSKCLFTLFEKCTSKSNKRESG